MKDLFEGLKRAKARAALSAATALLFTAAACIGAYAAMPKMIALPIAAVLLGCMFLFLINFLNIKKRKNEFASIINNGVTVKAIKKQLMAEALVVAVVFSLIGCGIGVAAARPVSTKLISSQMGNFQTPPTTDENGEYSGESSEGGNSFFPGGFDTSNLPDGFDPSNAPSGNRPQMPNGEDFDINNLPEGFDKDNIPGGFDKDNIPEDFDKENMPNREDMKRPMGNSKMGVAASAAAGAISVILFSLSSIIGVALPIKKEN